MKFELNNESIENLKKFVEIENSIEYNKNIVADIFDVDDVEFEIDDEIFVDVKNDNEFIENVVAICILNRITGGSINIYDIEFDDILYHRFININSYEIRNKILNTSNNDKKFFYYHQFIDKYYNKNLINFIYELLNIYDIFIADIYENYESIYENDVAIKNKFLIDEYYIIDDIFYHDNKKSYPDNYNELIECIYIYDYDDVIYDIDELFEINDNLSYYVDYDKIIDDLIADNYYYEFENYYIHNCYF